MEHRFIESSQPKKGAIAQASHLVVEHYLERHLGVKQNLNKWRKESRTWTLEWTNKSSTIRSKSINYRILSEHIRKSNSFDPSVFDLQPMSCFWQDLNVDIKIDWHMAENEVPFGIINGMLQQQYGERYPIRPKLQREGILYPSFQPQLIKRIIKSRNTLIVNSNSALTDEWIFDLRGLISDTISLIDITLNQLYIKAEYDPLPRWKFDKLLLGERNGRRLKDRLHWVHQITGKRINIAGQYSSLMNLKEIRNHLMHFDPPSLIITIEEATLWLNQIIDIGSILIEIRKATDSEISTELINYLLQREAVFIPLHKHNREKIGTRPGEDYYSSVWPKNLK